jgi:hypothetical protein
MKMKDKLREGIEKGMDLGREQGYTIAKEAFDDIIKVTKAREAPKPSTTSAGTQTDPTAMYSTISMQTDINSMSSTPHISSGTQTNHLDTISHPTADRFEPYYQ